MIAKSRFRISPEINTRNEDFSRRFVLADRAPVRVVCATARAAGKSCAYATRLKTRRASKSCARASAIGRS